MHAMQSAMSRFHRANPNLPYKIEPDTEVPVRDDQKCYVVTMDEGNILRVTVTTDGYRISDWVDTATDLFGSGLVGLHAEPRLFKSKLVNTSPLQPSIHVLFFAIGRRVLVYELIRGNRDLLWMLTMQLARLNLHPYRFVGMQMERIRRCLKEYHLDLWNLTDVEELAVEHTGREELRTAGLKKITRAVMGIDLDPVLSRRFWMDRWLSDGLSPVLVMQGSIRVFMALMVVRTIRNYPPLPQHDQQEQAAGSSSGSGQPQLDQQKLAAVMALMGSRTIRNYPPLPQHDQQEQAAGSSSGSGQPSQHDQQLAAGTNLNFTLPLQQRILLPRPSLSSSGSQPQHDQQEQGSS